MDHPCPFCSYTLPVKYSYAGPHIKAECANCLRYIKFVGKSTIPSYIDSKNKIWAYTNDLDEINKLKIQVGIHDKLEGIHKDIAYHNLYCELIKRDHV